MMEYGPIIWILIFIVSVVVAHLVKESQPNMSVYAYFGVIFGTAALLVTVYIQVAAYIVNVRSVEDPLSIVTALPVDDSDFSSPPTSFELGGDTTLAFQLPQRVASRDGGGGLPNNWRWNTCPQIAR